MNTIKYLQIFLIIVLLLVTSLSWKVTSSLRERYTECESIDKGLGLPLSAIKTINFIGRTSYKEMDESRIIALTSPLNDIVFWGEVTDQNRTLNVNDDRLLKILSNKLLTINNRLEKGEKPFKVIRGKIMSKYDTTTKEYKISSKHIIYREGKMFGFVLNVESLWTNPDLELRGCTEVIPTGILMEDSIFMLKNEDQSNFDVKGRNSREYGDFYSFIQSEAIMKDRSYEDDVTQKQAYGLLQDRGLSKIDLAADEKN